MKSIEIELEAADGSLTTVAVAYGDQERIREVIERYEQAGETERGAVLDAALATVSQLDDARFAGEIAWPEERVRLKRACVEVFVEGEPKQHNFPIRARWARVHRWGCHAFGIARDACVHLELREGGPTGPALNERQEIGPQVGCKVVWLVKPGPEPNG
jgi:hypothetical protein